MELGQITKTSGVTLKLADVGSEVVRGIRGLGARGERENQVC